MSVRLLLIVNSNYQDLFIRFFHLFRIHFFVLQVVRRKEQLWLSSISTFRTWKKPLPLVRTPTAWSHAPALDLSEPYGVSVSTCPEEITASITMDRLPVLRSQKTLTSSSSVDKVYYSFRNLNPETVYMQLQSYVAQDYYNSQGHPLRNLDRIIIWIQDNDLITE